MNYILDNQNVVINNIVLGNKSLIKIRRQYIESEKELDDIMNEVARQSTEENMKQY